MRLSTRETDAPAAGPGHAAAPVRGPDPPAAAVHRAVDGTGGAGMGGAAPRPDAERADERSAGGAGSHGAAHRPGGAGPGGTGPAGAVRHPGGGPDPDAAVQRLAAGRGTPASVAALAPGGNRAVQRLVSAGAPARPAAPRPAAPRPAAPHRSAPHPSAPHPSAPHPSAPRTSLPRPAAVRRAPAAPLQPRLTVGRPGDPYERQADAVAARVTAGEAPAGPAPAVARLAGPAAAPAGAPDGEAPPSLAALLADPGPGAPLSADVRARVEPHLGHDLGAVQVHSSPAAQAAAAGLGARAFTSGSHVFLAAGESAGDLALMAHEATHVVQQQAAGVHPLGLQRAGDGLLPDFILDEVRDLAHAVPGYDMLTVVAGYDPIANRTVDRSPENLVRGVLGLVPFGGVVAGKLIELNVVQGAFRMIDAGLTAHNLTLQRIQAELDQAWDELSVDKGIDGNVAVITRHVDGLYRDALAFVRGVIDAVVQLIRDAAAGLAERYLAGTPVWSLTTKVLHHDPLRGTPVEATTVEILADFLTLIGKQDTLAQMRERGTLQKTADWLDTQLARFQGLVGELTALFAAAWAAIQPENVANLADNLAALARDAVGLVQRVGAFAADIMVAVLRLIKDALLDWLSREAAGLRGFRLLTVIVGQNPFTGQSVPRTAENLIGGFIALLPGGEATYQRLAEAGVVADAAAQIEAAMSRLGISLDMVTATFLGVWNSLTLEDLLNPVAAFVRVLDRFGEPLGRIVAFAGEVLKVVVTLILKLMNFPSELLGSIVANAMAAIEDIKRDPVAFFMNLLLALKTGFVNFFDRVLDHLMAGLADWLFRGLGALGIQKPPDLSFRSILELVLQVLDVTADKLWEKLGRHVGADVVVRIRSGIAMAGQAFDFVKDVQDNGVAAIWRHVEGQLGNLWDTLLGMVRDWLVTTVIEKAVAKVLSMLDPTGIMAVVNSCIAFFRAVQSVIEYVREILQVVDDYVGTLAAVAAGNIGAGAAKVERGLAGAVPMAIGFLANQVGLGNVPEKLVELIGRLREIVDAALDWLFERAAALGRSALAALGVGGGPDAAAGTPGGPVDRHFDVAGHDHRIYTGPGGELMVASDPTAVARLERMRTLHADYRALPPDARPADRDRIIDAMVAMVREHPELVGELAGQRLGDPPNLGDVLPYRSQTATFQPPSGDPSFARLWEMEREHVIPRQFVGTFFDASQEVLDTRGGFSMASVDSAEYGSLYTVMIYKGAADEKTDAVSGDLAQIRAFATEYGRWLLRLRSDRRPGDSVQDDMADARRRLNAFGPRFDNAYGRTVTAVRNEWRVNAAARGWGADGAARLTWLEGRVRDGYQQQGPQMVALLWDHISDAFERMAPAAADD